MCNVVQSMFCAYSTVLYLLNKYVSSPFVEKNSNDDAYDEDDS